MRSTQLILYRARPLSLQISLPLTASLQTRPLLDESARGAIVAVRARALLEAARPVALDEADDDAS